MDSARCGEVGVKRKQRNVRRLGIKSLTVMSSGGQMGWQTRAPVSCFDAIYLNFLEAYALVSFFPPAILKTAKSAIVATKLATIWTLV